MPTEYSALLKDYLHNLEQKKKYEELEKLIKEQIFENMKSENLDELEIEHPETNIKYVCGYGSRSFKSPDYDLLLETVGIQKYNEIVEEKQSIFPIIKKAKKKKIEPINKNNILKDDDFQPQPLMGNLC